MKILQNSQENIFARGVFLWILRNFQERLFYRKPLGDRFFRSLLPTLSLITLTYHVNLKIIENKTLIMSFQDIRT